MGEVIERPAHVEPVPLFRWFDGRLGEHPIGDVVVEALELVERREVAVDHHVEQRGMANPVSSPPV